jgi:hypothetical protein
MRSVLRATTAVIALGAIAFLAYAHYDHRHPVGSGDKPLHFGLGGPFERAVVITPKETSGSITTGDHASVLVAKNVLFRNMYVLNAGAAGKIVTLRATPTQAAALIRQSRTANHQLVVQRKPAGTTQG